MAWKFGKWVEDKLGGKDEVSESYKQYGKYGYDSMFDDWDDKDDYDWKPKKVEKGGSLSSWWGGVGGGFKRWVGSGDSNLLKRASALTTVSKVGRIIFRDGVKFTWKASEAGVAGLTGRADHVALDPAPLDSKEVSGWTEDERVDALVGDAIARAAYLKHVGKGKEAAAKIEGRGIALDASVDPKFVEAAGEVAKALYNTAAYVYSEAQTVKQFPGYAGYFSKERDFAHRENIEATQKATANMLYSQNEKSIAAAAIAAMWEGAAGKTLEVGDGDFQDAVREIAQDLRSQAYAATSKDELIQIAKLAMQRMLSRFTFEDSDQQDGDQQGEGEGQGGDGQGNGQAVADAANSLKLDEEGRDATPQNALSEAEGEEVSDAVDREYSKVEWDKEMLPRVGKNKGRALNVPIYTIKQLPNKAGYTTALGQVRALVSKVRASLLFRNEDRAEHELSKRRGQVDDGGIHKLALADPKVFRRTEIISAPRVDVGILVDESGSMAGQRAAMARKCAILMQEAMRGLRGVTCSVWGHTGDCNKAPDGVLIMRYLEMGVGDVKTLGAIQGRSNNYDGYAVSWCVKRMLRLGTAENKILFVLLDGNPCAHRYGDSDAVQHTKEVVDQARRAGVMVFGVGMGGGVNARDLQNMYGTNGWIEVPDVAKLPLMLSKLMKRALRTGSL